MKEIKLNNGITLDFSKVTAEKGGNQSPPAELLPKAKNYDDSKGIAIYELMQGELQAQQLLDTAQAICKEYANNIKDTEAQRSKLLKGLKAGDPSEDLLKIACDIIAITTHDKTFSEYTQQLINERKTAQPKA